VGLCFGAAQLAGWFWTTTSVWGPDNYVRSVSDFLATLTGALIVQEGHGPLLYDLAAQRDAQARLVAPSFTLAPDVLLPYNHLPFEALLLAPLAGGPPSAAYALWSVLMVASAIGAVALLRGALLPTGPRGWALLAAALSYHPLHRSLWLGQNTALVLLGLCGAYAALRRGREVLAGPPLVLVAFKPQIAPLVLAILVLERRWRALASFAALAIGLAVAAMPVLGAGWPLAYARLLLGVADWRGTGVINPRIMHNWRGLAANLADLAGWPPVTATALHYGLTAASLALLGWAWWRLRRPDDRRPAGATAATVEPDRRARDLLWALTGVVAVLVSPHLNPHDLALLLFPAWIAGAYATSGAWDAGQSRLWLALLWAGYLLPLALYAGPRPAVAVVPSVLLLATAAGLLAWQLRRGSDRGRGAAPNRDLSPTLHAEGHAHSRRR
jgi:hypothetical protein